MSNRIVIALQAFCLCLAIFMVSGCSNTGGKDEDTVKIWHWMTDRQEAFEKLAKDYFDQTGVKVVFETYAPTDNVSELTARTNDEGWETTFAEWLKTSHLNGKDCIMVFSVGGGSETTSLNIVNALKLAKERGAKIISIVSRTGGYSKQVSDSCVLIPVVDDARITPHAEGWQGVVWHLMVNALVKC